jgi:hypothetical protein
MISFCACKPVAYNMSQSCVFTFVYMLIYIVDLDIYLIISHLPSHSPIVFSSNNNSSNFILGLISLMSFCFEFFLSREVQVGSPDYQQREKADNTY